VKRPRNVRIAGRRTSLRLEPEYWSALVEIGRRERLLLHDLCTFIRRRDPERSLASAIRVFVTVYFHDLAEADAGRMVPDAESADQAAPPTHQGTLASLESASL
jgi:predicted DNA-binding ribbon-helix-helix protein